MLYNKLKMFDNSRHERVALVILSYVIGFVTAFIAYGLNKADQVISVINTDEVEKVSETRVEVPVPVPVPVDAVYENGRFYIETPERQILVSAKPSALGMTDDEILKRPQGLHKDISATDIDQDGGHVFFCEQHTSEATCRPFVYDVENVIVYRVMVDGAPVDLPIDQANDSDWSDNKLRVSSYTSVDSEKPWHLAKG